MDDKDPTLKREDTRRSSALIKFVHPFIVLRDSLRKRFLHRRKPAAGHDPRVVRKAPVRRPDGSVPFTSTEKKIRHCYGVSNMWYQFEDQTCSPYWMNDITRNRLRKKPLGATIVQPLLPIGKNAGWEERLEYLSNETPIYDYATEVRQLLTLSENESIQRARDQAANFGAKQLEHASIHNLRDLLEVLNMQDREHIFTDAGIDLQTIYFLKESDMHELDLKVGERVRLNHALQCMRKIEVESRGPAAQVRNTKFIKDDIVEHFREGDCLIRRGRVVCVHLDDIARGVYYTVSVENEPGSEIQANERKLKWPGEWEVEVRASGREPIFKEPGGDEEDQGGLTYENVPSAEDGTQTQYAEEDINNNQESEMVSEELAEADDAGQGNSEDAENEYSNRGPPPLPTLHYADGERAGDEPPVGEYNGEGMNEQFPEVSEEVEIVEIGEDIAEHNYEESQNPSSDNNDSEIVGNGDANEGSYGDPPTYTETLPMYSGRSRVGSLAQKQVETVDDRNPSIVSIIPMLESEEFDLEDENDSGVSRPPPGAPERRRSSAISNQSSSQRPSIASIVSAVELEEFEDDGEEESGMRMPPPPAPHRSDSLASVEEHLETMEVMSIRSMSIMGEDDDSGMAHAPPPIPISRSNSGSRRESLLNRRNSDGRRVSFTGDGSQAKFKPSPLTSSLRRASSASNTSQLEEIPVEEEIQIQEDLDLGESHQGAN